MKLGIYPELSNEDYHKDNGFLSSSRIKLILQSPELYYKKYIKKEAKEESSDIFDTGTAIHMRILEPDKYATDVVFFSGIRRGNNWEEFKKINKGKLILGDMQKMQLDRMYDSFIKSEVGPKLISGGQSECSLFTSIDGFNIKVRADYLDTEHRIIFDLKSTSGIISEEKFKYNLESKLYGYDLQAALYVDTYSAHFKGNRKFYFYWIVMSKDFDDIRFYKASEELIEQGRKKYRNALDLIKMNEENEWKFENNVIEIFPSNLFQGEDL